MIKPNQFSTPARLDILSDEKALERLKLLRNELNSEGLQGKHISHTLPSIFGCTREQCRIALDLSNNHYQKFIKLKPNESKNNPKTISLTLIIRLYIQAPQYWPIARPAEIDVQLLDENLPKWITPWQKGIISLLTGRSKSRGYAWLKGGLNNNPSPTMQILGYLTTLVSSEEDKSAEFEEFLREIIGPETEYRDIPDIFNSLSWNTDET
jgi:hypothetical protein